LLEPASIGSLYDRAIVDTGRQPEFLFFVAFLVTFGFIRTSAHLIRAQVSWWPGNVEVGGTHIHHLVWGILLLLITGYLGVVIAPPSPWHEIFAVLFGIGTGLTLDEFALWLYLDDVYWSERGRSSVDATVVAVCFLGLVLIGARPVDLSNSSLGAVIGSVITIVFILVVIAISLAKERRWHAFFGFFVAPVAMYAACRIGKPGSPWGKRRYGERNPKKQAKAERRFRANRRTERLKEWLRDAIGGSTEEEYLAKIERRS
jgi:hypothetical protein